MRWSDLRDERCSVARALAGVGDRWTLLLVRECMLGTRRFEDFQANTGAPRAIVAGRLRTLVDEGVLTRDAYQDRPARYEYRLTDKGRDLAPVVMALLTWGDRWAASPDGPPVTLVHRGCGRPMHPAPHCDQCGAPLGPDDVRAVVDRPGA